MKSNWKSILKLNVDRRTVEKRGSFKQYSYQYLYFLFYYFIFVNRFTVVLAYLFLHYCNCFISFDPLSLTSSSAEYSESEYKLIYQVLTIASLKTMTYTDILRRIKSLTKNQPKGHLLFRRWRIDGEMKDYWLTKGMRWLLTQLRESFAIVWQQIEYSTK
jgi:hypothetical protein